MKISIYRRYRSSRIGYEWHNYDGYRWLHVWVGSAPGVPLAGAVVCLTGPREVYAVATTDICGGVSLATIGAAAGDTLTVTVTNDGYRPYQGTVSVQTTRTVSRRLRHYR